MAKNNQEEYEVLKVFEAFAGYGSQRMALRNLGIEHEVVATSEVDEYAILSYGAIHGSDLDKELPESEEVIKEYLTKLNVPLTDKGKLKNLRGKRLRRLYNALNQSNGLGDISKIDVNEVPNHDLFTYSFPCQDISVAGTQEGFDKGSGTRSGLLWECQRIISAKRPKYLLMENVKNLVGKRFKSGFEEWQEYLTSIGYTNYWEVLNAKDFGIPQNRERVFMVSILGEHDPYVFPKPIKLEKRLKDVLEEEVDEKYYLSDEQTQKLIATIKDTKDIKDIEQQEGLKMNRNEVSGKADIAQTLLARDYKGFGNQDMNGVIKPERILGIFDKENSTHQAGAVYNKDKIAPTLDTMQGGWRQPSIIDEPKIAASRGRGKSNEQQLEMNKEGTSNALTTVEKDNYVLEGVDVHPFSKKLEFQGYKQNEISPCLLATDYKAPKTVLEGTPIKNNTAQGYLMGNEPTIVDAIYNNREPRVYDEYEPTLRSERHGLDVVNKYRIRKLTPLECFRLMDVSDEDFYKAQSVNSNTQLYKQAGNSIVVAVLEAIFRNMFLEIPDEDLIG